MIDSDSMETTALHFTILDILRVMDEWIRQSGNALKSCQHTWKNYLRAQKHQDKRDGANITSNWEVLISCHGDLCKILLDRISQKTEEIKNLRDGVSTGNC